MLKKLQEAQEHPQEAATLAAGAVLKAEQPMELVEPLVEGLEHGMRCEEKAKAFGLRRGKSLRTFAQECVAGAALAQGGNELFGQFEKVVAGEPNDMEAVGHEDGLWEEASHQAAVGAGAVDADNAHLVATPEGSK